MTAVAIKGWCPGALRPMRSGDGLVVRVRPRAGRLDATQVNCIAELAERYGNGLIDLTSRANFQIRGVSDEGHAPLIEELARLRLLDPDPESEARRNILVTPFSTVGDETASLAAELEQALATGPRGLPAKFGFAVDHGPQRALASASADVRIERGIAGELIVRADGAEYGRPVTHPEAVKIALALAEWFIVSGGRGRMAAHIRAGARLPDALRGQVKPARMLSAPRPGLYPEGAMVGVAFGQLSHAALSHLAGCARGLRMTPWRMILVEGLREMPHCEGIVTQADDPVLRVVACSGAPACRQAHAIGFSQGEHKFLHVVDFDGDGDDDVLDGVSGATHNRTFLRKNLGGWTAWEETPIPQPEGIGQYQDVTTGDIDADGDLDLAFSYSHAEGDLSGVIWLNAGPDGSWERNEISGPPGTKFDNVELHDVDGDGDLDAVTTEQIEQLGIIWYENPG